MSTGWTLDYVKWNVDLPTLARLSAYWRKLPPIHVLVAGYVGYKPTEQPAKGKVAATAVQGPTAEQDASLQQFFNMVPQQAQPRPPQ